MGYKTKSMLHQIGGEDEKEARKLMASYRSKRWNAYQQERMGLAQIKHNVKPGSHIVNFNRTPVGQERIDIAKKMRLDASKDSLRAVTIYPELLKELKH